MIYDGMSKQTLLKASMEENLGLNVLCTYALCNKLKAVLISFLKGSK